MFEPLLPLFLLLPLPVDLACPIRIPEHLRRMLHIATYLRSCSALKRRLQQAQARCSTATRHIRSHAPHGASLDAPAVQPRLRGRLRDRTTVQFRHVRLDHRNLLVWQPTVSRMHLLGPISG